jgi:hypothetical protein
LFILIGKSLDAILELKKKNKLPNAFKVKKHRKKEIIEKQKDVFTLLDKIFTSEMGSSKNLYEDLLKKKRIFIGNQDSTPSPLDKFKDKNTTVDETSLLLHTQVRFSEIRILFNHFFFDFLDRST